MKNIFVLKTDKPSRLAFDIDDEFYILSEEPVLFQHQHEVENRNIYITSDEKIKEDDWILKCSSVNDWNFKSGELQEKDYSYFKVKCVSLVLLNPEDKKIILTTDPKLIADGVYYGNKEQYWKRHESICKKLKDNEE